MMKFLMRLLVDLSVVLAFLHLTLLPIFVDPSQREYLPMYAYCYLFLYFVLRVLEGWLARRGLEKRLREAEAIIEMKRPPIEVDETYEPMNDEAEAMLAQENESPAVAKAVEAPVKKSEPIAPPALPKAEAKPEASKPASASAPPPWSREAKAAEEKAEPAKPGLEKSLQPPAEADKQAKTDGDKAPAEPEKKSE